MEVLNYSLLRKNLKKILDSVVDDQETVIINRGDQNAVIISLEEYNGWKETMHLLSTEANRKRLQATISRDSGMGYIEKELLPDK